MVLSHRLIVGIGIFLAGCGSVKTPVGPTCVSCKPYFVRGAWYHPQDHYEYDEIGLASWYGDAFHGKQKATGERFDKMAMTAAHKTLPIPSIAEVTNMRNGRSLVVIIDDRGPYYPGRIIDLSYGAAKELDLHRFKPSQVRVKVLVADSYKLSLYIALHCKRRKDPLGRSWAQLYFQEILGLSQTQHFKHQHSVKLQKVKRASVTKVDTRKMKHRRLGSSLHLG
jgi:rare lipoprotein A